MSQWIRAEVPKWHHQTMQVSDEEYDKILYPQPNQEPSMSYTPKDPMPNIDPNRVNDFPENSQRPEEEPSTFFKELYESDKNNTLADFIQSCKDEDHPYHGLAKALLDAYEQASAGKGKERHAQGQKFEKQPINTFTDSMGTTAGLCFQVQKKCQESLRLNDEAAIHELRGAIVYASAMINWRQNNSEKETCYQVKKLQSD